MCLASWIFLVSQTCPDVAASRPQHRKPANPHMAANCRPATGTPPAQTLRHAGAGTRDRQSHIWLPAPARLQGTTLARTMWQHQKQANPQMAASPGPSTGSHLWPRHCGGNTRSGQAHMWLQAARDPHMWWAAREFPKQLPHRNASRANYTHKGKKTGS